MPDNENQQGTSRQTTSIEPEPQSEESISTCSLDVPTINFEKYQGQPE